MAIPDEPVLQTLRDKGRGQYHTFV